MSGARDYTGPKLSRCLREVTLSIFRLENARMNDTGQVEDPKTLPMHRFRRFSPSLLRQKPRSQRLAENKRCKVKPRTCPVSSICAFLPRFFDKMGCAALLGFVLSACCCLPAWVWRVEMGVSSLSIDSLSKSSNSFISQ